MNLLEIPLERTTRLPVPTSCQEHSAVLDLFGQNAVAFHRSFVDIAGGVVGALWLSHAISILARREEGAFFLSQADCQAATGLTRREQETARQRLRSAGILREQRVGRRVAAHLDLGVVAQLLVYRASAKSPI